MATHEQGTTNRHGGRMDKLRISNGQIQAARRIDDGGLAEISPPRKTGNEKAFKAELEELMGPYRQRFNLEKQIKKYSN